MRGLERRCQHKKKNTCRAQVSCGRICGWILAAATVRGVLGVWGRRGPGMGGGVQLPDISVGQEMIWGGSSYRIYM